LISVKYP